ncbi:MAG: damage-inducible protein D [Bacteroidia bacterium]
MDIAVITFPTDNYYHKAAELQIEKNLIYYASEAAEEMGFESIEELQEAVRRAMELCRANGLPVNNNFRRIFKCSSAGLVFDWQLSVLAYHLVQLNGDPSNNRVAKLQLDLLKNLYQ